MKFINWDWRPAVLDGWDAFAVLAAGEDWSRVDRDDVAHTGYVMSKTEWRQTFEPHFGRLNLWRIPWSPTRHDLCSHDRSAVGRLIREVRRGVPADGEFASKTMHRHGLDGVSGYCLSDRRHRWMVEKGVQAIFLNDSDGRIPSIPTHRANLK